MKPINKGNQENFNKSLLCFAAIFKDVVKNDKWVSRYDSESDSLSFTTKKLPDDSRLHYFNDEFAVYISESSKKINGLFIEYFMSNFLSHQKEFKEIKTIISKDVKDKEGIQEIKNIENNKFVEKFQKIMLESIAKDISFKSVYGVCQ